MRSISFPGTHFVCYPLCSMDAEHACGVARCSRGEPGGEGGGVGRVRGWRAAGVGGCWP